MKISKVAKDRTKTSGILYLLVFELEGKPLVKIGVTTRTIEERTTEILVGIFKKYRVFPYCKPKRFRTTEMVYEKEAQLHKFFSVHKYSTQHKFGGSTEFFDIPIDDVVKVYEELLDGKDIFQGG